MNDPLQSTLVAERPENLHLRLYVAGASPRSLHAFANLSSLCVEHVAGHYEIEVVDLVKEPALARRDDIVAIPTLVRCTPGPRRKIIGDLSDANRVLAALQIGAAHSP